MRDKLDALLKRAGNIYFLPKNAVLGIRSYVTNNYNPRDREGNNIMWEAQRTFGFVPLEILDAVPSQHQKKWDRNIRW
jgi:hypothetical protein